MKKHYLPLVFQFLYHRVVLLCLLGAAATGVRGQSTQPDLPAGPYTNTVSFDFTLKKFLFHYRGSDTVTYEYKPTTTGTLAPLKCVVGSYSYNASNAGGFSMDVAGATIYPWSAGVSFSLKSVNAVADTLYARWRMSYAADSLLYTYKFFLSGRTLTIGVEAESANANYFSLDRSSNTTNPKIIPVPYLTLFNILYTNNLFTSLYADWETTTASDIIPVSYEASATSVAYAHNLMYNKLTNGKRNTPKETIYLTASPKINEVFPGLPNPVSPMKTASAGRIVYDYWASTFANLMTVTRQFKRNHGINNLWVINHIWQNGGFDNKYPNTMPANAAMGGDTALTRLGDSLAAYNYLFGLHENYVDFYPNAASWNPADIGLNSNGTQRTAWKNNTTGIQSYLMKPTRASYYAGLFAPTIHATYKTTAVYNDVASSVNPAAKVDYDSAVAGAGKFTSVLNNYRSLLATLRASHAGPVSGEGLHHFLYAGYVDDVEAQINTGSSGYWSAVRMPLLVDFQLQKIHPKMCGHGVGYYERFFSDTLGKPVNMIYNFDSTLTYAATELAYGNASFIPGGGVPDLFKVAKLEQKHVFAAQQYYADAIPVSIVYNDNGVERDASEYIKRYPAAFLNRADSNFMAQVKITYDNGMIVCVNRNMYKLWQVNIGGAGGWFNYHAILNGVDSLNTGISDSTRYLLPAKNGWVVYMPQETPALKAAETPATVKATPKPQIAVWPVPSTGLIYVKVPALYANLPLKLIATDMSGKPVLVSALKNGTQQFQIAYPGTYIVTVYTAAGTKISSEKVIITSGR